jgi:signal transduction histidine kinase
MPTRVWQRFHMRRPRLSLGEGPARLGSDRVRAAVLDAVGAALLWSAMAVDLATRPITPGQSAATVVAYLLAGAICVPFAIHRRFPVGAMLASNLALIVYSINRFTAFPGYAIFALVFGVGLHVGRRRAVVVYLGGVVGLIIALWLQPSGVATASSWISTILTVTVAWLAGENLRARRARRNQELTDAQRLAQQRVDEGRRAVSEERLRIARDLHDVVANSMSVIAVQAGVANHVMDERPELVRQALGTIEVTARQGLVELRRLLGVLRSDEEGAERTGSGPAEGLRDLDRLLDQFRSAGLRLDAQNPDEISDLPAALDISAYRIVQEGLTNVLRHGGPAVHLTIRRSEAALLVEIRDDGRPRGSVPTGPPGSGHGLTGIRERAALFGGTVVAEPQPGGGFGLCVELPLGLTVESR